jgi:hypothetical protein
MGAERLRRALNGRLLARGNLAQSQPFGELGNFFDVTL